MLRTSTLYFLIILVFYTFSCQTFILPSLQCPSRPDNSKHTTHAQEHLVFSRNPRKESSRVAFGVFGGLEGIGRKSWAELPFAVKEGNRDMLEVALVRPSDGTDRHFLHRNPPAGDCCVWGQQESARVCTQFLPPMCV